MAVCFEKFLSSRLLINSSNTLILMAMKRINPNTSKRLLKGRRRRIKTNPYLVETSEQLNWTTIAANEELDEEDKKPNKEEGE